MLQKVKILECPHEGRHQGAIGYLDKVYSDGSAGVDLGFDHVCIADRYEVVSDDAAVSEVQPPRRRGRPRKTIHLSPDANVDEAPEISNIDVRIVSIERLGIDRFNVTFKCGTSTLEAKEISLADVAMIAEMVETMKGEDAEDLSALS